LIIKKERPWKRGLKSSTPRTEQNGMKGEGGELGKKGKYADPQNERVVLTGGSADSHVPTKAPGFTNLQEGINKRRSKVG